MMKIRLARDARADLGSIRDYTEKFHGTARADHYLDLLQAGFSTLRRHPQIGYSVAHLKAGFRCFQVEYHRIFYRPGADSVDIVAILHESQLPRLHLNDRDEDFS